MHRFVLRAHGTLVADVPEKCCQRRAAADWKQLLRLHTRLQTTASVGSTPMLPAEWTTDFFSGAPGGGVALTMGPPARWQLGHKKMPCTCCSAGEHAKRVDSGHLNLITGPDLWDTEPEPEPVPEPVPEPEPEPELEPEPEPG